MKYIITESEIDTIIISYLDSYIVKDDVKIVEQTGDYFFWINDAAFYGNLGLLFSYYSQRYELGISRRLRDNLEDMFGVNHLNSSQIISKWFENTFEFEVDSYYWL